MIDATLKRIFQRPPNLLLSQALGENIVVARALPTESILVENLQPDMLLETEDGRLVHSELHGYPMMEKFAVRNLIYFGLILRDYARPPLQIVFWVGNRKTGVTDGLDFPPHLHFHYRVIDVRELDGAPLLESPETGEAIFSVLCRHEDRQAAVARIVARIRALPREQWPEAIGELLVLSGLRGLAGAVKAEVARMPYTIDIHENEFLEEVWQEGKQEGRQQGRQEGRQEGLDHGRRLACGLLTDTLEQRLGAINPETRAKIEGADLETLHQWTRRAIVCARIEDVFGPVQE